MAAFSLRVPLGTNYRADPDDIMDTKRALNQRGACRRGGLHASRGRLQGPPIGNVKACRLRLTSAKAWQRSRH